MFLNIKKIKRLLFRKINYVYLKLNKPKTIFTNIYKKNGWDGSESVSGSGSDLSETKKIIHDLETVFKKFYIKSILDVPCGDFNWMRNVDFKNIKYIGGDIVTDLVIKNRTRYGSSGCEFIEIDITKDDIPAVDLVFVRDCFVHLSFKDILMSINNIYNSGSKYLITTSFLNRYENKDIATGEWRTLNLKKEPFNFPDPIYTIIEGCKEGGGEYKDKALVMWRISDLR